MECVIAVYTITCGAERMAGTVVEHDSDDTKQKLQPPSKTVIMKSSDPKTEIVHALDNCYFMKRLTFSGQSKSTDQLDQRFTLTDREGFRDYFKGCITVELLYIF